MKISTKGRYALRMMLDLARYQSAGSVALKDIAKRQSISKKYLEQIVPLLTKASLINANRGFQGGYFLVKPPKDYTIFEILRSMEGSLCPVSCLEYNPIGCQRRMECETLNLWKGLDKVISEYLSGITLQDLLDEENAKILNDYSI